MCECFIIWQKACDCVRVISNLYKDQNVKLKMVQVVTRRGRLEEGLDSVRNVRQGCCLSPVLFNRYSKYLTKEAVEGFGDFKIGGQ
jgi:hypothetical protein